MIIVIFIAILAFLVGFYVGVKSEPTTKKNKTKTSKESEIFMTEYENFLNYDGSVQQ